MHSPHSYRLSLPENDSAGTLASGQEDADCKDVEEGHASGACSGGKPDSQPVIGREDAADAARSALQGRFCLLAVAVLWGSYPVALRQASVHPLFLMT